MERGVGVSFIQKATGRGAGKTKTMASFSARLVRDMSPRSREGSSAAICAERELVPRMSVTFGRFVCGAGEALSRATERSRASSAKAGFLIKVVGE